jgi:hypothetical protein
VFERRIPNPTVTLQRLGSELRAAGLIKVVVVWVNADAHFSARIGEKLRKLVGQPNQMPDEEIVYSAVVRAARKARFQPHIEDVGVWLDGENVSGIVRAVPFHEMTTALDRLWARMNMNCVSSSDGGRVVASVPNLPFRG